MPKDVRLAVTQVIATRTVAELQKALAGETILSVQSTPTRLTLVTKTRVEVHIEWDNGPVLVGMDYLINVPLEDADIATVTANVTGR
jgi:hypothetical protein